MNHLLIRNYPRKAREIPYPTTVDIKKLRSKASTTIRIYFFNLKVFTAVASGTLFDGTVVF